MTEINDLARDLIVASDMLRSAHDTEWNAANAQHFAAQQAFRAAIERLTGMSVDRLEAALGEL